MPRKKLKVSNESYSSLQVIHCIDFCYSASDVPQTTISALPSEIYRKIFGYLNPQTLLAISKLGVQRLTEQTCSFRSADFSVCDTITAEDVQSFFNRERVKHVREINFNNLFFVLPSILTTCIEKCKHLTILSVLNCGVTYFNITSIFNSCPDLQELYWSVQEIEKCPSKPSNEKSSNVKKLYLQVNFEMSHFTTVNRILDLCPTAEDVCLNYSSCYVTSLPPSLASRHFTVQLTQKDRAYPLNVVLNGSAECVPYATKNFIRSMCSVRKLPSHQLFETGKNDMSHFLTRHSSFLQFLAENDNLADLPTLPNDSVRSMVIIMNENNEILKHLEKIKKMTGKALTHLSLYKTSQTINLLCYHHPWNFADRNENNSVDTPFISEVLCGVTSNSCNISVLNLSELHFQGLFPFSSLCNLKQLKVLTLSTCCFQLSKLILQGTDFERQVVAEKFENLAMNCQKVEQFSLYGCKSCVLGPTDEMVVPISKWKELRSLTLCNVETFRRCQFLMHVANSCTRLKSVELIALSIPSLCHYVPSVAHVLIRSKELTFLRINQPGFYPMDSVFWKSLESGKNLQGVCLATGSITAIENKPILDAIRELPHLHLFHLIARRTCQNLYAQVKRIMTTNGVKTPNVKIGTSSACESYDECFVRHLPIT